MKTNHARNLVTLVTIAMLLNACSAAATADPAAIATSAVQTVEARYTQLATNQTPSETPALALTATTANVVATPIPAITPVTSTPQPVDSNGKACYTAIFMEDVTVPDGMLVAPGSTFTKKWRIQNAGNCTWDSTYSLTLQATAPGTAPTL
jgi:hypothetical protein